MAMRSVPISQFGDGYSTVRNFNLSSAEEKFADMWERLKIGLFGSDHGISNAMLRIEKQCQYPSEDSSVKAHELFARLKKKFFPELKEYGLALAQETVSSSDYLALQNIRNSHADLDLYSIWLKHGDGLRAKLSAVGAFDNNPPPKTLLEMKVWLTNSVNSVYLNQITELDLSQMELRTLPHEIFRFKALKILRLAGNFFSTFPYDLNAFPQLAQYSLEENALQDLPRNHCLQNRKNPSKLDVEVMCNLKQGQVLGVRETVPGNTSCAWKQINEFQWTGSSWVGQIPRRTQFSFICIDHITKSISDEKIEGTRVTRIGCEEQRKIFLAGDVQF